jgi:acetyltransferase EpsM
MRVAVAGAGGHAKVVADALLLRGESDLIGFFDDDRELWGRRIFGYPVMGPVAAWSTHAIDRLVIAVGNNHRRKLLFERLVTSGAVLMTVVHPSAIIGRDVIFGVGAVVLGGVLVNAGSTIADNVILNTACSIDHDNHIDAHSHIGPGVHTAGDVRIGEGAFLGVGANVLPAVSVGAWSIVGAGAVVTRNVEDHAKVAGNPARNLKSR